MSSPAETALTVARMLADAMVKLVPAPVAHQLVTDAEVKLANALGELADDRKFGRHIIDDGPPEGDQSG